MTISTYDPALVFPSLAGIVLSGFADGTFIEAERSEDGFTLTVGASGEAARAQARNRSGRVTFTVLATSQVNDALSALAAQDELLSTGVGVFHMTEARGTTVLHAENAWIMKLPKIERNKEVATVEWVIECEDLEVFAGGLV
jgi:hypothetical protein